MSQSFAGTSATVSNFMPWTSPTLTLMREGVYMGEQLGTGKNVFLDVQSLIANDLIPSGNIGVVANIKHGKGTLTKDYCIKLAGVQAGVDEHGRHVQTRSWAKDHKLEAGTGEWKKVGEFYLRESTELAQLRICPFLGTSERDDTELGILMAADVKGAPLSTYQAFCVQVVVAEMYRFKKPLSVEYAQRASATMSRDRLLAYMTGDSLKALKELYVKECKEDPEFAKHFKLVVDTDPNIVTNDSLLGQFIEASSEVASYFNQILNTGEYGNIFGGLQRLDDLLADRFCHLDWVGTTPAAKRLLETVLKFWEIKMARKEGGNPRIAPHHIFSDEQGSELDNEAHAALEAEDNRKRRAVQTVSWNMYQYITDPLTVGAPNSSLRTHGQVIFKGMAAWLVGEQPDDDETLNALTRAGASDFEAMSCTTLKRGQWALISKGHRAEFFNHRLTRSVKPSIDTTSAARRAGQRQQTSASPDYLRSLEELQMALRASAE